MKTPAERSDQHRDNIEKLVTRILNLDSKLAKKVGSRKYPLTEAQKKGVSDALADGFEQVNSAMTPTGVSATQFKLSD